MYKPFYAGHVARPRCPSSRSSSSSPCSSASSRGCSLAAARETSMRCAQLPLRRAEPGRTMMRATPGHGQAIHVYDGIEEHGQQAAQLVAGHPLGHPRLRRRVLVLLRGDVRSAPDQLRSKPQSGRGGERRASATRSSDECARDPDRGRGHARARARQLFQSNCAACHGAQGQGHIGPNLTDTFWLHGGKPAAHPQSPSPRAVAAKGMPAWERDPGRRARAGGHRLRADAQGTERGAARRRRASPSRVGRDRRDGAALDRASALSPTARGWPSSPLGREGAVPHPAARAVRRAASPSTRAAAGARGRPPRGAPRRRGRRFYLFGGTFNAQDVWLVLFLATAVGFALLFVTAWRGRVWCGWACPQTVFLEGLYRPDRALRRRPARAHA